MKKITSVIFISLALALLMSVSTFAAVDIIDSGDEGNYEWELNEEGELYIEGDYIDSITNINKQKAPWYEYRDEIVSITFDDDIYDIGAYAFYGLYALEEVELPEDLTAIGQYAFSDCKSLTKIDIPDYVEVINTGAFYNCTALKSVSLPNNLERIRMGAFENCKKLTEIFIYDDVTTIGEDAFAGCSNLTEVYFTGDKPSTIGDNAFEDLDENEDLVIYYIKGNSGFTKSNWKNYTLDTFTYNGSKNDDDDDDDDGWISDSKNDDDDDDDVYYGDLNGDGKINSTDLSRLRYALAHRKNYDIEDYEDVADVDEDGKITPIDEMILARYIDDWDDYDLPN